MLSVKPELPRFTSHAHGTMESAERPEFPSGRQNITFNLLFVCRATCHSLAEDLESFHSSAKEVNEIFDRVILGTAGGGHLILLPVKQSQQRPCSLCLGDDIFKGQLLKCSRETPVGVTLFVAPLCNLWSTPKLPPPRLAVAPPSRLEEPLSNICQQR